MCYRLYLATPLTLSEVRAMMPDGMAAHLVSAPLRDLLLDHHPPAREVVELCHGGCACDLAGRRLPSVEEDERRLRAGYRAIHAPRAAVIRALDAHRHRPRGRGVSRPSPESLAGFVAEHARNAGPALYYLRFTAEPASAPSLPPAPPRRLRAGEVGAAPRGWLPDETPTVVVP